MVLIGIAAFFGSAYYFYAATEYYKIFTKGIHTTAIVSEIEENVEYDGETNEDVFTYFLHLELPDYNGWKLGKKYEKAINPNKYKVGDVVEIIHNRDKPTEILVKKEITLMHNPKVCFMIGVLLYLLSYTSCYVIE